MGDANLICTLGDYSNPSHEGYMNTINSPWGTMWCLFDLTPSGSITTWPPKQNPFTFNERVDPNPQPQASGTTFEARVRDYMATHTERMDRFKNAIFKQREEINDRMAEMFELLKELTTSRAPKKVLIRVKAKSLVTKNVNYISLAIGEEERNDNGDMEADEGINWTNTEMPVKEAKKETEDENETKNQTN
nr:hypothetical protein [Tanacetum cinerariifolium]